MASTQLPLVINGEDVLTSATFDVVSPATGELLHTSSSAGVAEAVAAVEAAGAAFPAWRRTHVDERRAILLRASEVMRTSGDALKTAMRNETGSDAAWADMNLHIATEGIVHAASHLVNIEGRMPTVADPGREALIVREPYGVVFSIVPWYVFLTRRGPPRPPRQLRKLIPSFFFCQERTAPSRHPRHRVGHCRRQHRRAQGL